MLLLPSFSCALSASLMAASVEDCFPCEIPDGEVDEASSLLFLVMTNSNFSC